MINVILSVTFNKHINLTKIIAFGFLFTKPIHRPSFRHSFQSSQEKTEQKQKQFEAKKIEIPSWLSRLAHQLWPHNVMGQCTFYELMITPANRTVCIFLLVRSKVTTKKCLPEICFLMFVVSTCCFHASILFFFGVLIRLTYISCLWISNLLTFGHIFSVILLFSIFVK